MIDLKKNFRKILREWGHDVSIQRKLKNGNYSQTLEKYTTRHVGQTGTRNATSAQEGLEGINANYDMVYYFEAEVAPREGDRIYEDLGMGIVRDYTIYTIDISTPVRGRMGKIVYWIVGATREK
jgi:hypothetical protein